MEEKKQFNGQAELRKKNAEIYKEKLEVKPLEEWLEISRDVKSKKGGKVILCRKTKAAVTRFYLGRENEQGSVNLVQKFKSENKKVVIK